MFFLGGGGGLHVPLTQLHQGCRLKKWFPFQYSGNPDLAAILFFKQMLGSTAWCCLWYRPALVTWWIMSHAQLQCHLVIFLNLLISYDHSSVFMLRLNLMKSYWETMGNFLNSYGYWWESWFCIGFASALFYLHHFFLKHNLPFEEAIPPSIGLIQKTLKCFSIAQAQIWAGHCV